MPESSVMFATSPKKELRSSSHIDDSFFDVDRDRVHANHDTEKGKLMNSQHIYHGTERAQQQ